MIQNYEIESIIKAFGDAAKRAKTAGFDAVEIQGKNADAFLDKHPFLKEYRIFHNSDAHALPMISEKTYSIDLQEKTIDAFFSYLRGED